MDGYNWGQQSALWFKGDDITVSNCEFSHTGMTGLFATQSNRVSITNNVFFDIGYNGVMTMDRPPGVRQDMMIANNLMNGCGVAKFWQPACIWADGRKNVSVINNDVTNVPNHALR